MSPDGLTLVSSSADASIKLWTYSTGVCYKTLTGHSSAVKI